MDKTVKITISGIQNDETGQELLTKTAAEGQYYEKGDCHYILYQETDPESGHITKNTLKWTKGRLELIRRGNISSHMIFEPGRTLPTGYTTPYGTLTLDVSTETLRILQTDEAVSIRIGYQLSAEASFLSANELTIIASQL